MDSRLVIALVIASSSAVPGFATAAGMFCEPGQSWTTVDSGTITSEGWSVVNFTKPPGGQVQVVWEYEDFDDGPATAGFWMGSEPEDIALGTSIHTTDQDRGADVQIDLQEFDRAENATLTREPGPVGYGGTQTVTLGAAWVAQDLPLLHYAAGEDSDGWHLSWTIRADQCITEHPDVASTTGDNVSFLTADDFHGTVNAQADLSPSPALGPEGATALIDANAARSVAGTPFVEVFWSNHAGEIQMDGPNGLAREDAMCPDRAWYTWCLAWGNWTVNPFEPGRYAFQTTGFTDPTNEPTDPVRGPYITLLPTTVPSRTSGEPT